MKLNSSLVAVLSAAALSSALIAANANAQMTAPKPTQTATDAAKNLGKAQLTKPDFTVAIDRVSFNCPGPNDDPPFLLMQVTVKNVGGPFDTNQSVSYRWSVDGVNRSATAPNTTGTWATQLNAGGLVLSKNSVPVDWFTKAGKADPTKLAQPKSVLVTFRWDTTNSVDESNEANNVAETTATIPANLCK